MNRKKTTKFLSDMLKVKLLTGIGKYYASEVTLDYGKGKGKTKRVDFIRFVPKNQLSISGIEHGEFISYEVKSCKNDFNSGCGRNFVCEKNYIVTTMTCYKEIINDIPWNVGVIVPIPISKDKYSEFENPTELNDNINEWTLQIIKNSHTVDREKSIIELLFYMLRSGK